MEFRSQTLNKFNSKETAGMNYNSKETAFANENGRNKKKKGNTDPQEEGIICNTVQALKTERDSNQFGNTVVAYFERERNSNQFRNTVVAYFKRERNSNHPKQKNPE